MRLAVVLLLGCGTAGSVDVTDLGDASTDDSLHHPTSQSNVVRWEPCTPGHERIVLNIGTALHVLTRGECSPEYEAGLPHAMVYPGSEDGPILFSVWGCDDAGSFSTLAETPSQLSGDLWADASMLTYLDYGNIDIGNSFGRITVDDWPDAGGLVSGRFGGFDPTANAPGSLSGTFCVVRERLY